MFPIFGLRNIQFARPSTSIFLGCVWLGTIENRSSLHGPSRNSELVSLCEFIAQSLEMGWISATRGARDPLRVKADRFDWAVDFQILASKQRGP